MVTVEPISYAVIREHPELLAEYAAECAVPGLPPINPCWAMYEVLESSGGYQVFAAYIDGKMAGFSGILATINPHYSVMMATVESLFVGGGYRDGVAPARLMRTIEAHAAARRCTAILYSALAGSFLEKALGKRYARTNSVFCKPLARLAGPTCEGQSF